MPPPNDSGRTSRRLRPADPVGERLPVGVADDEAGVGLVDGPGRREAALGMAADGRFDIAHFEVPPHLGDFGPSHGDAACPGMRIFLVGRRGARPIERRPAARFPWLDHAVQGC